ncbi:MAG: HAMP domain-containing histidine kinase [Blautia sp.]|nr:HAMP domain-containing histidine kinase [Blautia sp.]MCM1201875.1 HAMP domain-containing histidine kinase [Bacteroides fragilis]
MLDTKLKNGNAGKHRNAVWTGILLAGLSAALFVALFPEFGAKAAVYEESYKKERFESEDFLASLIQSNYVLYKNVLDKKGNKVHTYEELYMEDYVENIGADLDAVPGAGHYDGGQKNVYEYEENDWVTEASDYAIDGSGARYAEEGQLNSILSLYAGRMQERAADIRDEYVEEIGTRMDFYVLDKESGTFMKNTMLPIEELADTPENNDNRTVLDDYVYYILMDYDAAGNLQNIGVRGSDADKLLKAVQTTESGRYGRLLVDREEIETYALYDADTGEIRKYLSVSQRKPANAIFIYAMTKAQQEDLLSGGWTPFFYRSSFGYSYYNAGVQTVYALLMGGILLVTVLLTLCRPAFLTGKRERKAYFEIVFCGAAALFAFGTEAAVCLVQIAESGALLDWLNWNLPVKLAQGMEYEMVKNAFCFGLLAIWFGLWYFCCLELSDILRGVRNYLKTRVLCYVIVQKTASCCKKAYRKLKEQILGVDLGEDAGKVLRKLLFINFCLLSAACLCWSFGIFIVLAYTFVLYWFLKKYIYRIQQQYRRLLEAADSIARGRLDNALDEDFGVFESYKQELYEIQNGFQKAVEEEVRSQRMKTELITNVSHDLKTPLTAIITYIDLLKEENTTEAQRKEYLETLERKSMRLKVLIEDLFEVSRANSGNVNLEPVPVDICHLMRQVYLEYEDKMEEAGLQVRFTAPEEKIILQLDSQKTYRIFENLYVNIIKYALHDTRVFVTAAKCGGSGGTPSGVRIEMKNISEQEILGDPQELSERFVRGDASRNSEGSGLGLAIARSLTELQGGRFRIELDGDLFKVILIFTP